ncbi:MAG: flagellar motor switch protein FliN [Pirellulales bacterium]|nr:flagellar motor switch protein FliN [Pirellulales bacterium]
MADEQIGQDEIEQLLKSAQQAAGGAPPPSPSKAPEAAIDDAALDQSEIERLLAGGQLASKTSASAPRPAAAVAAAPEPIVSQSDVEALLNKAEAALESFDEPLSPLPRGIKQFEFQDFAGASANPDSATLDLMRDVQLDLTIELGRTHMHLEDVLRLKKGAVVPLDKLAGDPADIYVNGRLVARGEVLVLNDNFCVRVAELVVSDHAA